MLTSNHYYGYRQFGYVALFSIIILSAVFLLLFIGIVRIAMGGMSRAEDKENEFRAISWVNTCVEEALDTIRRDPDDTINNIFIGEDYDGCRIQDAVKDGNGISFRAVGESSDYTRSTQIEANYEEGEKMRTVEIIKWSEI